MWEELAFEPLPLIRSSHSQIIIGSFLSISKQPLSVTRFIPLSDGDEISVEMSTPHGWKSPMPTAVMLHGLCGSHRSGYMSRLTFRLLEKGFRCARMNMRGCGTGFGHARHIYHSGRSDDLLAVLEDLVDEAPLSKIFLIGFSLGANIVLKLAGELGAIGSDYISQVVAISPPADLYHNILRFQRPENRLYENYFINLLKTEVKKRHQLFPELPRTKFPKRMSLLKFDEIYTAPHCGFKDVLDYYEKSSSKPLIEGITPNTRILFSKDDPLIDETMLDELVFPDNIKIYKTLKGGHIGYLARKKDGGLFWLDHLIENWITS